MVAKKSTAVTSVECVLSDPQPKKHVVRYDAAEDDSAVANVYVTKLALEKLGNPGEIRITIEAA